jgi:phosphopantothenoylcysteine decarboxylase
MQCVISPQVWRDEDEWEGYGSVGDAVLHIDLTKRSRVLLFAPLCANSLAQLVAGSSASLALSVARAWTFDLDEDFGSSIVERYGRHAMSKPVIVAPAMNTFMWHQRITQDHIVALKNKGVMVVEPVEKILACGDSGKGAMADPKLVAEVAARLFREHESASVAAIRQGKPEFLP